MKIIYGVAGEGMGHCIRSSTVIDELLKKGHEVHAVSSGRAAKFLENKYKNTLEIDGLTIQYKDNKVQKLKTFISNANVAKKSIKSFKKVNKLFMKFQPDVVITDFETSVNVVAKLYDIPVISVDNIQAINRCSISHNLKTSDYHIAKTIVKAKVPNCYSYIITTFDDRMLVKKNNTHLVSPILRKEILNTTTSVKDHIVVYQTAENSKDIIDFLKNTNENYLVYGYKRDITEDVIEGNVVFRPFSEQRFIRDIASCKAVICGGSFTVITESLFLKKPILSCPIVGQFEQFLNANSIQDMGYGKYVQEFSQNTINEFINSLEFYRENLASYCHDFNKIFFDLLDEHLRTIFDETNNI